VPNYLKFGHTHSQHGDSSNVQSRSETAKERPKAATRVVNKEIEVRQMNSVRDFSLQFLTRPIDATYYYLTEASAAVDRAREAFRIDQFLPTG
jgi:hypothetical protein